MSWGAIRPDHVSVPGDRWYEDAACAGLDLDRFFPSTNNAAAIAAAKAVCASCPVTARCLAEALAAEGQLGAASRAGIWGALTGSERAAAAGAERHGIYGMYLRHRRRGEEPCPACRDAKRNYYSTKGAEPAAQGGHA